MSAPSSAARPVTVITGASAGIGAALAHVFARNGHDLLLVARREQKLCELAEAIETAGGRRPHVLALDLTQAGATQRITDELSKLGLEPQYVVNNAGFGLLGIAANLDRADQLAMIDLNVRALVDLSLAFVDSLSRHRGGILNVSSVAGFLPGPGMAVYYATKAFVVSFSESLHQELAGRGIRVTTLCPGPVPTEFQARAGIKRIPGGTLLEVSAEAAAEAGYAGLMQGRRVVVPGFANKVVTLLPHIVPRGFFLRAVARAQLWQATPAKGSGS
jgi:short-subunit dehydrogenase